MQKRYAVLFEGGESRHGQYGVDYMLVEVPDRDGDMVELYAEADTTDIWDAEAGCYKEGFDEHSFYEDLKAEIVRQAEAVGFDPRLLDFWLD